MFQNVPKKFVTGLISIYSGCKTKFNGFYFQLTLCPIAKMMPQVDITLSEGQLITASYSHSMVAGGFELISYTTLFTPFTLLMMSFEILARKS